MATSTKSAGSAVNGSGGGSTNWTNPGNVTSSDDNYATCVFGNEGDSSKDLDCTNFGFSIPAGSTIDGIEVNIERNGGTQIQDTSIKLLNDDGAGGESAQDKSAGATWSSTDAVVTFGGSTDTWGETWSVSDVNSSSFGVRIQCEDVNFDFQLGIAGIDHVEIVVHYTAVAASDVAKYGSSASSAVHFGSSEVIKIYHGTQTIYQ